MQQQEMFCKAHNVALLSVINAFSVNICFHQICFILNKGDMWLTCHDLHRGEVGEWQDMQHKARGDEKAHRVAVALCFSNIMEQPSSHSHVFLFASEAFLCAFEGKLRYRSPSPCITMSRPPRPLGGYRITRTKHNKGNLLPRQIP